MNIKEFREIVEEAGTYGHAVESQLNKAEINHIVDSATRLVIAELVKVIHDLEAVHPLEANNNVVRMYLQDVIVERIEELTNSLKGQSKS